MKTNVIRKQVTLDKKNYNKYILAYMKRKGLRSLSIAVEMMSMELYKEVEPKPTVNSKATKSNTEKT